MARAAGGTFLLRMEDIDTARCRAEWEDLIYEDLTWLGLSWDGPVMRQSDRMPAYQAALDRLQKLGSLYPCACTRKDIAAALSAPQEGGGFDGPPYPGTCKGRDIDLSQPHALRINMKTAVEGIDFLTFTETGAGASEVIRIGTEDLVGRDGDVVLSRKDIGTSYHLSVVVDDAEQGVTDVVRGEDLAPATGVQVLLQNLLSLPRPTYHHHRLIRDEAGKRLAKRDDARAIRTYRKDGATPDDLRQMVGLNPR